MVKLRRWTGTVLLWAGVLLPLFILMVSLRTEEPGDPMFDPIESRWHVGLLTALSLANLFVLAAIRWQVPRLQELTVLLRGFTLPYAVLCAVVVLPSLPVTVVVTTVLPIALVDALIHPSPDNAAARNLHLEDWDTWVPLVLALMAIAPLLWIESWVVGGRRLRAGIPPASFPRLRRVLVAGLLVGALATLVPGDSMRKAHRAMVAQFAS